MQGMEAGHWYPKRRPPGPLTKRSNNSKIYGGGEPVQAAPRPGPTPAGPPMTGTGVMLGCPPPAVGDPHLGVKVGSAAAPEWSDGAILPVRPGRVL